MGATLNIWIKQHLSLPFFALHRNLSLEKNSKLEYPQISNIITAPLNRILFILLIISHCVPLAGLSDPVHFSAISSNQYACNEQIIGRVERVNPRDLCTALPDWRTHKEAQGTRVKLRLISRNGLRVLWEEIASYFIFMLCEWGCKYCVNRILYEGDETEG